MEECSAANATRPRCSLRKTALEGGKKRRRRRTGRGEEQEEEHTPRLLGDRLLLTWQKVRKKPLCVGPIIFYSPFSFPLSPFEDGGIFLLLPDIKVNNVACRHNFPGNTIKCAVNL